MASWPTTLPSPNVNGYSLKPVDQTIRTDMEGGAARSRRRTSARNDQTPSTWQMTDAQMTIFRAWFENASTGAGGGAIWFTVSLPIGTGGMAAVTARFVGAYTAAYLDGFNWTVSATLEIR